MLDYDEEVARSTPSLEIDSTEDFIYKSDLTDISDILDAVVNGKQLPDED